MMPDPQTAARVAPVLTVAGSPPPEGRRGLIAFSALALLALAVVFGVSWEMREAAVIVRRDALLLQSRAYSAEVPVLAIRDVQLLDTLPSPVHRVRAFHVGDVYHGRFVIGAAADTAELFLDASTPPFIALRTASGLVLFNEAEPARTRARYEALAGRYAHKVEAPARSATKLRTARAVPR